jgi:hypothetical protein
MNAFPGSKRRWRVDFGPARFAFDPESRSLETPLLSASHQVMARDEQIRQRRGDEQPIGILRQPTVAHLHEPEHALDHPEQVLDLNPERY